MSMPEYAKVNALYNPVGRNPGFVYPSHTDGNDYYIQDVNEVGQVMGLTKLTNVSENTVQTAEVDEEFVLGSSPLYGFLFRDGNLLIGTQNELAVQLLDRVDDLKEYPFAFKRVIGFIDKVLPEKANSSILAERQNKANWDIAKFLSKYDESIANEWLGIEVASNFLKHMDHGKYLSYRDLLSELNNLTGNEDRVFIKVQLVRSLIGTSPKFRGKLSSFVKSSKINTESHYIPLDKFHLPNLKQVLNHILITEILVEVNIPVVIRLSIRICDPQATRKRYLKKNLKKNVKNRHYRDYRCEIHLDQLNVDGD